MQKSPSPKVYGVLGYPAKHSLSPRMHNAAFRALNINAEYVIFEKNREELEDFLSSLSKNNIHGLNVTIPYKEEVLKYLKWKSPEVRFTDASNTIEVKDNNYLKGWNTDGIGFHRHLTRDLKFKILGKNVIILGAGGAAKAIVSQLARKGAKSIIIYDIDINKSSKLAEKINNEFPECQASALSHLEKINTRGIELLINATPIGMKDSDPCLIAPDKLRPGLFVYELIYNPAQTKLLRLAKERGATVSNGLGMLLYQGALSFEHFTGESAPLEIMRQALKEGVAKL